MSIQDAIALLANAVADKEKDPDLSNDLVKGADGIAKFLFGSDAAKFRRKVYHLADPKRADRLPVFRMGNQLFARKSTLLKVIEQRECVSG